MRLWSKTDIRIQPGHNYVFYEGDPVTVSVAVFTRKISNRACNIQIEQKSLKPGAKWEPFYALACYPNKWVSFTGKMKDTATGAIRIRARTVQNPDIKGSISRTILINVHKR